MCIIFALPFAREEDFIGDNRPFLTGTFNGASVYCMSKFCFEAIPNHDSLESVSVRSARGEKIVNGTYAICATAFDKLGVWDSINKVNYDDNIFAAVTNSLD